DRYHVYVSVGHQQMMTEALKPLGLSVYQLTGFIHRPEAGGRLFVDISAQLATSAGRAMLMGTLGKGDPLTKDALLTLMDRLGPVEPPSGDSSQPSPARGHQAAPADVDPSVVDELIKETLASIEELRQNIHSKSGPELFDYVLEDIQLLKKQMTDPRSVGLIWAGPTLVWWLNDHMKEWLDETNVADTLSQSVPDNITSQMGLDLLDVADVIRPNPAVVDYLKQAREETYLDGLVGIEGGQAASEAIRAFLDRYGMRCAAEIDLTRPRWGEKPTTLLPMLLGNIRNFAPGESRRRFEQGRLEAEAKAQDLLSRLRQLPDGERLAEETRHKIETLRAITGYREFPKYAIVSRYYLYKQALSKEAERLVQAGVVRDKADLDYLTFPEFREVVRTHELDDSLIERRKAEHELYERLTPPRVITSDGEIIAGAYQRDHLPAEALVGMPVSRGVIEGRARVIRSIDEAHLEEGDVLVTAFTDPSWTPLFVAIKGLVTEVGGLMTHGSVIAREYGLPAVVGVEHATRLIRDGQRIRVHGTDGYVEILS
ncbi:MAG TPA: PEP-utilizing enzyme, partial [Stenomitos sp.]